MTIIRTLAPITALALVVVFSVVATASSGALTFAASPLLIAAIALAVWHDRTETDAPAATSSN